MKKTVVFDFDGVIHSYTSGWKGTTCIPDPPVHGIEKALKDIHDAGYEVVIVSTRCDSFFGRVAIENWLDLYGLSVFVDRVCKEKPPAIVYIDDRAICFDGHPEKLLEKIKAFKPWNKSPETNADRIRAMTDEELCDLLDEWWCMGANNDERLAYADERLAWLQQLAGEEKEGADNG